MLDKINVSDIALIFEGGGTRASNTAGVLNAFLDNGVFFKDVFGISAGSSHTVNYISRDTVRARASFVEYMGLPEVAGKKHFLRGKGYFNAEYIYQISGLKNGALPFNFEAFMSSPSEMHIGAYEVDTNKTVSWTKADVETIHDLMLRVQASSSMPVAMPPVHLNGHVYYDGGLGSSWGVQLDEAIALGYEKFFVVCTQEKGFRKSEPSHPRISSFLMGRNPQVVERYLARPAHYNKLYDRLDELELAGKAIVYHPDSMPIKNTCTDVPTLASLYEDGYIKASLLMPSWLEFLGLA